LATLARPVRGQAVKARGGARRFERALGALRKAMAAEKRPVAVIGGIAINANGVARFTGDIDATIPGADLDLRALVRTLKAHAIVARMPKAIEFARENQVLLLKHVATGIELDLSLAWIPFELEAIERAKSMPFGPREFAPPAPKIS